jgi:hypothetical protein
VTIGWTASIDTRATGYAVRVGTGTSVSTKRTTATLTGLKCGRSYTVSVTATGASGATSSAIAVRVATAACAAPKLRFANLKSNVAVPLHFTAKLAASSAVGLSKVNVFVDGSRAKASARYAFALSVRPGRHTLTAVATDLRGTTTTVRITVLARRATR